MDLPGLGHVRLIGPRVTNAELQNVRELAHLSNLSLNGAQVTETGLATITSAAIRPAAA
jgi:hypothetical protein